MKKIFLTIAMMISIFCAKAQLNPNEVNDMALIWIGGDNRPDWNKELFDSYLTHTFPDGHTTWLFDGFLMIEGQVHDSEGNKYSLGESHDTPADKAQWIALLDRQLGTNDGLGCKALDERIGELLPVIGAPASKHKVVMMQCMPRPGHTTWGELNGRNLDFNLDADKIEAMKWYADLVVEKWNEARFRNIEFGGIYWLRESVEENEIPLAQAMTGYYRSKGMKSYWIPWFHAPSYDTWKSLGFDMIYHQPNYYFYTEFTKENCLNVAVNDAFKYECGLEMEFEGNWVRGLRDERVVEVQYNAGFYDNSPEFHQRFVDYIDAFEQGGAFKSKPLAYYSGFQAVHDFKHSTSERDRRLIDRLAALIESRHEASGWFVPAK